MLAGLSVRLALVLLPALAFGAVQDDAAYQRRLKELTAAAKLMNDVQPVRPEGSERDARPYLPRLAMDVALPGRQFIYVLHLVGPPDEEERPALTALLHHSDTLVRQNASLALARMRGRGKNSLGELMSAARRSSGKEQVRHIHAVAKIAPTAKETWDLVLEAHKTAEGEERRALGQELASSVLWGNRDPAALTVVAEAARKSDRPDNIYARALDKAAGRTRRRPLARPPADPTRSLTWLWAILGASGGLAVLAWLKQRRTSSAPRPPPPMATAVPPPAPAAPPAPDPSAPRTKASDVLRALFLVPYLFVAWVAVSLGGLSWEVRCVLVALPLLLLTPELTKALGVDSWRKAAIYVAAVLALSGAGASALPGEEQLKREIYTQFVHRELHPSLRILDGDTERWLDSTRYVTFTIDEKGFEQIVRSGVWGGTFHPSSAGVVAPLVERLSSQWRIASPLRDSRVEYWINEGGRVVLARRSEDHWTGLYAGNRYDKITR